MVGTVSLLARVGDYGRCTFRRSLPRSSVVYDFLEDGRSRYTHLSELGATAPQQLLRSYPCCEINVHSFLGGVHMRACESGTLELHRTALRACFRRLKIRAACDRMVLALRAPQSACTVDDEKKPRLEGVLLLFYAGSAMAHAHEEEKALSASFHVLYRLAR
eukprot:6202687-Pleurochrysis_carterae.AAC.1